MYSLGSAHLDSGKQVLFLGDRMVTLQRKPYLILEYLIENRHRMVNRKELLDCFWDGKDVYDQSLSKAVGSIRKAFGETRNSSEFIETRWGLGYRYVGPFGEVPGPTGDLEEKTYSDPSAHRETSTSALVADRHSLVSSDQPQPFETVPPKLLRRLYLRPSQRTSIVLTGLLAIAAISALIFRGPSSNTNHRNAVQAATTSTVPIHSLAVLPFTSHTTDGTDAFLGIGLADAIATQLGTASQFTVRSSSTVRSVVGDHPDPVSAGTRLAVQAIVRGDIHREADKLVVSVRLLDGGTGKELWSGIFNANDTNLSSVEDVIAQEISNASLPASLASAVKRSDGQETAPEAYNKYMKAEFFASRRTWQSLEKAITLLNEAILIDPKYARAYAALADCYQLEGFYQFVAPAVASTRAEAAARKALSLDNSIAEAHISLLSSLTDYDWDWPAAENEFRAAIAINPNSAIAYQYYGYALLGSGRGHDALIAMKHAADLDPVSPSVQTSLGWCYYLMRQNQQASEQIKRTLELYPDFVPARQMLGILDGQMGLHDRSIADFRDAQRLEPRSSVTQLLLDTQLAKEGRRTDVERKLRNTSANASDRSVPDYYMAVAWSAVGDTHQAEMYLARGFQARSNWMIFLQYDPRFDSLRSDAKFQTLMSQITSSHPVLAGR